MFLYFLCYVAIFLLVVGIIVRAVKIAALPVHLRWELAPVPHEKGKSYGGSYLEEFEWWEQKREKSLLAEGWYMFQEIFLLKGVWEHNRKLWLFSLPFHQGLYFTIAMTAAFLAAAGLSLVGRIHIYSTVAQVALYLAWIGYGLGALGAVGLFFSRIISAKLRTFTTVATMFNLTLLAVLFISGLYALLTLADFEVQMTDFWRAMLQGEFIELPTPLIVHLAIAFSFVAYLPFTHMMHFVAKYFTYHKIRWDDQPLDQKLERRIQKLLEQPVTWSAEHVKADGKKNWVEIATEESGR